MVEIVQQGHKVLREIAKEVPVSEIKKEKIQNILRDMKEALNSQDDGVAIAAPQIAVSLRIFIVSGRIFDHDFIRGDKESMDKKSKKQTHADMVFINPVFIKMSKDKKLLHEGCLSVRPIYGKVRRATRATIKAYDENGKEFTKSGTDLLAHIFQHETDHLDGILFIDKARDTYESKPEDTK